MTREKFIIDITNQVGHLIQWVEIDTMHDIEMDEHLLSIGCVKQSISRQIKLLKATISAFQSDKRSRVWASGDKEKIVKCLVGLLGKKDEPLDYEEARACALFFFSGADELAIQTENLRPEQADFEELRAKATNWRHKVEFINARKAIKLTGRLRCLEDYKYGKSKSTMSLKKIGKVLETYHKGYFLCVLVDGSETAINCALKYRVNKMLESGKRHNTKIVSLAPCCLHKYISAKRPLIIPQSNNLL